MNNSHEDSIEMLDIYISTLKMLVEKYKKKKSINKFQKDEVIKSKYNYYL